VAKKRVGTTTTPLAEPDIKKKKIPLRGGGGRGRWGKAQVQVFRAKGVHYLSQKDGQGEARTPGCKDRKRDSSKGRDSSLLERVKNRVL